MKVSVVKERASTGTTCLARSWKAASRREWRSKRHWRISARPSSFTWKLWHSRRLGGGLEYFLGFCGAGLPPRRPSFCSAFSRFYRTRVVARVHSVAPGGSLERGAGARPHKSRRQNIRTATRRPTVPSNN